MHDIDIGRLRERLAANLGSAGTSGGELLMFLTDDEKRMRDGAEGPAVAAAMDLLLRYSDALDAERLCDIRNVAGTMTQPTPVKAKIVKEHGWDKAFAVINLDSDDDFEVPDMRVPTCQLQHGFGRDALGIVPYPKQNIELQASAESFYGRHGVNILATCTPYQVGNLPMRGEHCAWMESSAVIYANSVLGARTNCEGIASTGAASLTGKIPCWGNHRDENRYGTHHIEVSVRVDDFQDWGMLGYFAGGVSGEDHPVITGAIDSAGPDRPQALRRGGGHLGRRRAVPHPRHHAGGADARSRRSGGRDSRPRRSATARPSAARSTRRSTRSAPAPTSTSCCSAARTPRWTRSARRPPRSTGGRLSRGTELWIMAPRALKDVADRSGYTEIIERAGGKVLADSCPAMSPRRPEGHAGSFATDSAKQAHYLPAILGIEAWFGTHGGVRRRRRHRPLERRTAIDSARERRSSCAAGRSCRASRRARRWSRTSPSPAGAGSTRIKGTIIERRHELFGVCFTGKILVFPSAKGSSGLVGVLPDDAAVRHGAARHGDRPHLRQVGARRGGDPRPRHHRSRPRPVRGHRRPATGSASTLTRAPWRSAATPEGDPRRRPR